MHYTLLAHWTVVFVVEPLLDALLVVVVLTRKHNDSLPFFVLGVAHRASRSFENLQVLFEIGIDSGPMKLFKHFLGNSLRDFANFLS